MSSDAITPQPQPEPIPPAAAPETVTPTSEPAPRFDAEPYAPDGGASPAGLALLLGGTLLAAVVIGCLVGIVKQWFYLVLLFPAAVGAAVGGIGLVLIKRGKVRSAPLAGIAAVLGGVMAMGSLHYVGFLRYLNANPLVRAAAEAGKYSFRDYLDEYATSGVRIGRPGAKDGGMNLGYYGSYIYWFVEVLVVAGAALAMMLTQARAPFCRECGVWKDEKPLALVTTPTVDMAAEALREGQLASLLQCSAPVGPEGLLLKVAACPLCGAEGSVDVTLQHIAKNSKGEQQVKHVAQITYPGAVLRFLDSGPKAE